MMAWHAHHSSLILTSHVSKVGIIFWLPVGESCMSGYVLLLQNINMASLPFQIFPECSTHIFMALKLGLQTTSFQQNSWKSVNICPESTWLITLWLIDFRSKRPSVRKFSAMTQIGPGLRHNGENTIIEDDNMHCVFGITMFTREWPNILLKRASQTDLLKHKYLLFCETSCASKYIGKQWEDKTNIWTKTSEFLRTSTSRGVSACQEIH